MIRSQRAAAMAIAMIVLGLQNPAMAQKPDLEVLTAGVEVTPLRIASIDDERRVVSEWVDYKPNWKRCSRFSHYDLFGELGANGQPIGGLECGLPTDESRWYYGPTYCNTFIGNHVIGSTDGRIGECRLGWYWHVGGEGTSERCIITIQHWNDDPELCGSSGGSFGGGIALDFGVLPSGAGDAYYYSKIIMCYLNPAMNFVYNDRVMIHLAQALDDGSGEITPATCAQPMLWGGDLEDCGYDAGEFQLDDDNPRDGVHDAASECYPTEQCTCPGDLATMYAILDDGLGPQPRCSFNGEQIHVPMLRAGENVTIFTEDAYSEAYILLYAYEYSSQPKQFQFGDYCLASNLVPARGVGVIRAARTGGSPWSCTVRIPAQAAGRTVYIQALYPEPIACPESRSSQVVCRTIMD